MSPNPPKALISLILSFVLLYLNLPLGLAQTITPRIQEYTLPTGQKVYIKEDHSQPIVTIDTWVKVGSVNETKPINGVSHFLEHLLFKGTDAYPVGSFERILESKGGEFNAATSADFTHYYITIASPYFEEALKLHANMLLEASIPEEELERERKVVQEEINRAMDNPDRQMYNTLAKLIYKEHGYALDTLGPKEVIASIPRERILEYYHHWYQPKNFSTVIVGDVQPQDALKLVERYFPAPTYTPPAAYSVPEVGSPQKPAQPEVMVMESPSVTQAYLTLGFLGPSVQKTQDVYALDMAMLALGSGKSSRLYQRLKEQAPLVTTIGSGNYTQKHSGLVFVDTTLKPENLPQVKAAIREELEQLKAHGITADELEKAKTQYLKDFIFQDETTDGVARNVGYNVTIGSLEDYLRHTEHVRQVTLADVHEVINRYLDFNHAVLVEMFPASQKVDLEAAKAANLALLTEAPSLKPPALTPDTEASAPEVIKKPLENGMILLLKPRNDSKTVAVKVFVKGGQGVEFIPGTATLVSHLLKQGTLSRSAEEISRELESRGMSLSVSPGEDYIEITGNAIAEDLGELFLILQDVLTNPAFAEEEIVKQKEDLRQAIAASRDNPSAMVIENLTLALYPNHPYGNVGKRIEDHLKLINRDELLQYYQETFTPANMVVSVVGNFQPTLVENFFSALYLEDSTKTSTQPKATPPVPALPKPVTLTEQKAGQAATWMTRAWLTPPIDHQDYVPLKVLNALLGTGMSSRLFVNLREKQGLAYVVSSFYPSREQASRFVLYIGTDPKNKDTVVKAFQREIDLLKTDLITPQELQEAQDKLIGSFALSHETNTSQAFYLGMFETLGVGYQYDETYPQLIQQVTRQDIRRVARKYFSQPSVTALVEPAVSEPAAAP